MTQAEYWHSQCALRFVQAEPDLLHPWCRALLEESAIIAEMTGFCARLWVFDDGSMIILSVIGTQLTKATHPRKVWAFDSPSIRDDAAQHAAADALARVVAGYSRRVT